MNTQELLQLITGIAEEFKAIDLTVLDVAGRCDFADYFIVMSGASTTHVKSLSEELFFKCKHAGEAPNNVEGLSGGEWCLLDFGNIVAHVFHPEKRDYYQLEALWEAPVTAGAEETEG